MSKSIKAALSVMAITLANAAYADLPAGTDAVGEVLADSAFGDDIPLQFAVEQIVPQRYAVVYGPDVDVARKVSWRGGDRWDVVLKDTLIEEGLFAEISETGHIRITATPTVTRPTLSNGITIAEYNRPVAQHRPGSYADMLNGDTPGMILKTVESGDEAALSLEEALPLPEEAPEVVPEEKPFKHLSFLGQDIKPMPRPENLTEEAIFVGIDPEDIPAPDEVWPVFAGETLEGTLMEWGERAGWVVIWNSRYSYPITASAEFQGDFVAAGGALIEAMTHIQPKVRGEFFKNNVLVVSNDLNAN